MHVDAIHIENLASLLGNQPLIALRDPTAPLAAAGLVAITGPTGAGKSTILDALCLALFGQTPRLNKSEAAGLMSRGAVQARVEVDLTLDDGTPWRLMWSVRRARERLEGAYQAAERRIIDPRSGQVIASGIDEVQTQVARQVRLTLSQFRSVVLLAQGDFARFLQAKDSDRAELLEAITGTSIYQRLGQAAFARWKELNDACTRSDEVLAMMVVWSDEARLVYEHQLSELVPRLTELAIQHEALINDQRQLQAFHQATVTVADATRQMHEATAAWTAAAADQQRLQLAEAVLPVLAPVDTALAAGARLTWQKSLAAHAEAMATQAQLRADTAVELAVTHYQHVAGALQSLVVQAQIGTAWAMVLPATLHVLHTAQVHDDAATAQVAQQQQVLARLSAMLPAAEAAAVLAATHQVAARSALTHADQALVATTATFTARLAGRTAMAVRQRHQDVLAATAVHQESMPDVVALSDQAAVALAQVTAATHACRVAIDTLGHAEAAQAVQTQQVQRLTELAKAGAFVHLLIPGEACPLCGALDHPQPADAELSEPVAMARRQMEHLQQVLGSARQRLQQVQGVLNDAEKEHVRAQLAVAAAVATLAQRQARWRPLAASLELPQEPSAITPGTLATLLAEIISTVNALNAAESELQQHERARVGMAEQLHAADVRHIQASLTMRTIGDQCQTATAAVAQAQAVHLAAQARAGELLQALCKQLGEALPPLPEVWLAAAVERAESARRDQTQAEQGHLAVMAVTDDLRRWLPGDAILPPATIKAATAFRETLAMTQHGLREVGEARQQAEIARAAAVAAAVSVDGGVGELAAAEAALAAALAASPCPSVAAVQAARLDESQRLALRARLDFLLQTQAIAVDQHTRSQAALSVMRTALEERHLDPLLPEVATHLAAALAHIEQTRNDLHVTRGELSNQLEQDRQQHEKRGRLISEYAHVRARRERAQALKDLIGCATGTRFSRIAQALTLDVLLDLANQRLLDLAPRYHLRRMPEEPGKEPALGLWVIDHDQADTERAIATLSGGETFLVSLALALALADLQRGRVRVGTLCIDEGFGALDEHTLGQAMTVLERLQQRQGTQIIVISHVGALHERIQHRIEVERRGNGISRLRLVGPEAVIDTLPLLPNSPASNLIDAQTLADLLSILRAQGPLSNAQLQSLLNRDAAATRSLLKGLIERGEVSAEGIGKGRRYRAV